MRSLLVVQLMMVLAAASPALAWDDQGHETAAWIAYQDLKPETKSKVNDLLKKHPQYDLLAEKCPTGMDKDLYVFMRASTWPDMVRDKGNPLSKTDHHATWHYINFPIDMGNVHGPQPKSASWSPGTDPDNILQAIAKCEAELKADKVADADKAKDLCWLLHLVGDIHQPLHAVSMFSAQFPTGDRGGNSFWVDKDGKQINLHSLWDQALGTSNDVAAVASQAKKLRDDPKLTRTALADKISKAATPESWARESEALARSACYLDGKLVGAAGDKHNRATGQPAPLPAGYKQKMEEVARERVALAGYRMGELLAPALGSTAR